MGTVTVLHARPHRLPPPRQPSRARTAGVRRRRPVRLRPAAPVTRPDPDSGESRAAGQPDAFGDWFTTTPAPPRRGPPQVGRPSVRRPRVRRSRGSPPRARRPGRDRFGWLLSPWLLAPTAAVAVATTGVALWLWQTALTGTVQARPGSAVTATTPAASAGGLTDGPARPLQVRPPLPHGVTPTPAVSSQAPAPPRLRSSRPSLHPLRPLSPPMCPRRRWLPRLPRPRRNPGLPRARHRPPSAAHRPQSLSPPRHRPP